MWLNSIESQILCSLQVRGETRAGAGNWTEGVPLGNILGQITSAALLKLVAAFLCGDMYSRHMLQRYKAKQSNANLST